MAAKKPAKPRKFKQARKDAKSAAKETFSGKSQARLKDATTKLTADDRIALQEMKDTAKAQLGKNAYLDPKEYQATQEAAREKFRAGMREEGLYPEKKTSGTAKVTDRRTPAEKKASSKAAGKEVKANTKKAGSTKPGSLKIVDTPMGTNKPVTKGFAAGKTLNATGKARYDELIKQGVKPKSAMNKALFAQEKAAKVSGNAGTVAKPKPGLMDQIKKDVAKQKTNKTTVGKKSSTPKFVQSTRTNAPATTKEVAVRSKGTMASTASTPAKVTAASTAAKAKKFGKTKAVGKGLLLSALAAETVSAVKGSSEKDFREIQRLENKLASLKGQAPKYKNMGSNKNPISTLKTDAANFAALASMGAVGKTRRGRMDELNAMIEKAQTKKNKTIAKNRAAKPGVSAPGRSSSKINKTFSQASAASNTPAVGAGGSTISQGSAYRVKRGDTLSGIAKTAGVSLSDIMSANEKFKKNAKYKGGNMIFANTKVNIPKKK
jgi:LysM repeat protein